MDAFSLVIFFVIVFVIEICAVMIYMLYVTIWNIPVTLLRFVGDKGRPLLMHRKAKKVIKNGIPRLYVRGYPDPVRDYLAENYYPTPKGKYGGLILWEFEDGLLTPALPQKTLVQKSLTAIKGLLGKEDLSSEEKDLLERSQQFFKSKAVSFNFDKQIYEDLKLKIVDDVDQEFMLQEQYRLESQYSGGWSEFFLKYGSHVTIIIIAVLLLTGFVVALDKAPEFAAQCASVAQGVFQESLLAQAAGQLAPPG